MVLDWLLRRLDRRTEAPPQPTEGMAAPGVMQQASPPSLDGVYYGQPAILPGEVRRRAESDPAVMEKVREALDQQYRSQFGDPYFGYFGSPFRMPTENPLSEWSWSTRRYVLEICHQVADRNPLAHSILTYTANFTVGNGFAVTYRNRDVQTVVEEFLNNPDNAIRELERQAVIDLQTDGELVWRVYNEKGQIVVVPLRPWELRSIKTEMGFYRRPRQFHFQFNLDEGDSIESRQEFTEEVIPAKEILFVAINRRSYELRGRSDLYRLLPWLKAYIEWLSDRSRQSKYRGTLLWWVQVKNATSSMLTSIMSRWRQSPSPGSAYISSDSETVQPLVNPPGSSEAMEDGRQIKLMSIMGAQLPEYFFADGANANLATTTSQQLPALTRFAAMQQVMLRQVWTPLIRRVIEAAIEANLLDEMVEEQDAEGNPVPQSPVKDSGRTSDKLKVAVAVNETVPLEGELETESEEEPEQAETEMETEPETPQATSKIKAVDAFEMAYEPAAAENITELSAMLATATSMFDVSKQSAQEMLGFNPTLERRRNELERKSELDDMAKGMKPVPPPWTVGGEDPGYQMGPMAAKAKRDAREKEENGVLQPPQNPERET